MRVEYDLKNMTKSLCQGDIIYDDLSKVVDKLNQSSSDTGIIAAIVYGSVARRTNGEYSDIDIFLIHDGSCKNRDLRYYWSVLAEQECEFSKEIDFHFGTKDVVYTGEGIYANIIKEGVLIWKKD